MQILLITYQGISNTGEESKSRVALPTLLLLLDTTYPMEQGFFSYLPLWMSHGSPKVSHSLPPTPRPLADLFRLQLGWSVGGICGRSVFVGRDLIF
jgi:hypothetical protein